MGMSGARNLKVWAALLMAALAASVIMAVVLAGPAKAAATLFVTTTADEQNTNEQCSLREAIVNANANDQSGSADCGAGGTTEDEIRFNPGGSAATITLASQLPAITDSAGLTITGAGGVNITISGNRGTSMMINGVRVFQVDSSGKLTLDNLTVTNGSASVGGGIHNAGTLTVSNSTIADHLANNAGGIQNDPTGTMTVSNSTIADNTVYIGISGIINYGPATLKNTIVANTILDDSFLPGECGGTGGVPITDGGYNLDSDGTCGFATENNSLSGVDPMLGPLADNGGPTWTHALLEGSPAIDKGDSFGAIADQRGISRPLGAASDIGAFEFEDTIKPTVTGLQPAATATGVSRGANVVATFSEKMQKSTLTNPANFKLYKRTATGTYIQITDVTLTVANVSGTQARLNPYGGSATRLDRNTRYKAVLTTGVKDLAGNATAANKVWTFKTVS